jgi:hypothetical protein
MSGALRLATNRAELIRVLIGRSAERSDLSDGSRHALQQCVTQESWHLTASGVRPLAVCDYAENIKKQMLFQGLEGPLYRQNWLSKKYL